MDWIHNFHLFLFDFDGLLVNTESIHYRAYQNMCASRGFVLPWDFTTYSSYALHDASALKNNIYKEFPLLFQQEPKWEVLYREKKTIYSQLIEKETNFLMPGVLELLTRLKEANIERCVVTHSSKEHIDMIRKKHPVLNTIAHWITREDYSKPKPDPECYQKAVARFDKKKIVGFEDSPRGFQALLGSEAVPVIISSVTDKKEFEKVATKPFHFFDDFRSIDILNNLDASR